MTVRIVLGLAFLLGVSAGGQGQEIVNQPSSGPVITNGIPPAAAEVLVVPTASYSAFSSNLTTPSIAIYSRPYPTSYFSAPLGPIANLVANYVPPPAAVGANYAAMPETTYLSDPSLQTNVLPFNFNYSFQPMPNYAPAAPGRPVPAANRMTIDFGSYRGNLGLYADYMYGYPRY